MTVAYHADPLLSCAPFGPQDAPAVPAPDTRPAPALASDIPGYLSAADIAALRLVGLPTSKYRILELAKRERWPSIERMGRGGGLMYATAALPARALADLRTRRIDWASQQRSFGRPKGTDYWTRNPQVRAAVEAIIATRRLPATAVMELLQADFGELPSSRSLRREIARIEATAPALIASLRNPDAYKGKYKLALGRADADTSYAHEVWELDTTKADVMTRGGRVMILGVIDRWSRRSRFMVGRSESGQSVRALLVDTIRAWGVIPAAVMTDNGAGYINRSIKSALDLLGIEHRICPPGSPEKKPHIERLFGTFTRERARLLDGFAGHNVAEAQELRARAKKATGRAEVLASLDPDELQAILTAWTDGPYATRRHASLGMSPFQRWMSSPVPARAAPGADVLRAALSALVGTRTINKRGLVWQNGRYWAPELAAWVGRDVIVRRDEDELGVLLAFAPDGAFICAAVNHQRSGLSEQAFAQEAARQQANYLRAERKALRERGKRFSFEAARDQVFRRDAELAGKLVQLPQPTADHSTPAIASLTAAAYAGQDGRPDSAAATPLQAGNDTAATPVSPAPATPAAIIPLARTAAEKAREADLVVAAHARGEPVAPDTLRRAQAYQQSSEYRVERLCAAQLGRPDTPSTTTGHGA